MDSEGDFRLSHATDPGNRAPSCMPQSGDSSKQGTTAAMSKNVYVTARYRPEPDYERLARALLVLIEELDGETFALGDDPLAPSVYRQPKPAETPQEPPDEVNR